MEAFLGKTGQMLALTALLLALAGCSGSAPQPPSAAPNAEPAKKPSLSERLEAGAEARAEAKAEAEAIRAAEVKKAEESDTETPVE